MARHPFETAGARQSFRRRQASVEIGGAAGVAGGFVTVAESAPSLGENFAGVAFGTGILTGLGDLEGGFGVVAPSGRVAPGEGDASAEDEAIGVEEAVIARSGKVEAPFAGGDGGVEVAFAEMACGPGEVDTGEFLDHVAAAEGGLGPDRGPCS